jgi:hypothetical protein
LLLVLGGKNHKEDDKTGYAGASQGNQVLF